MSELSTIWVQWKSNGSGSGSWAPVEIRTVSVRAAFAFLPDPPPPGSQGLFEVRDDEGNVTRRGVCRVVFVREGVGAGLELRRRVGPSGEVTDSDPGFSQPPPSSQFRRPSRSPSTPPARASTPARRRPGQLDSTPPEMPRPEETPRIEIVEELPPRGADASRVSRGPVEASSQENQPPPELPDLDLGEPDERPSAFPPSTSQIPQSIDELPPIDLDSIDDLAPPPPPADLPLLDLEPPADPDATDPDAIDSDALDPDAIDFDAPTPEPGRRTPEPVFANYEAEVSRSEAPPPMDLEPPDPVDDTPLEDLSAVVATRTKGRGATEGYAIGIDLGTSNTCASVVVNGEAKVIPTRYGTTSVPSVYARVGHRVLVGEAAVKRMILDPTDTIYGSKRLIGRAYTEELAEDYQPYFAYRLAETRDHRFGAAIEHEVVSFEEVATALLEEVRDVASRHLGGPIDRAVITVPAYFTENQRQAVRRAARAARLMTDQLVPEPTAAALAFGHSSSKEGCYLVFDLGGGTFDVSIIRADEGEFRVLAIGGDPFLGGIDVDDMLANFLLEELHREIRTKVDPTPQQLARLREVAEECKRGLSVQETFSVSLPHFATIDERVVDLNATVSRDELEELAGPFLDRLMEITSETVSAAGLTPADLDEILLVGGMSRMPIVHERVEKLFQRRANRRVSPDEAVALGAALLASRIREVTLLDVLPLSIGIADEGRRFLRLIPRNTPLPTSKGFVVRTDEDMQTRYELPLYQGERKDAMQNEYLGTLVIDGIPPREAGRVIDLEIRLGDEATLTILARDGITGAALPVHVSGERSATEAGATHDAYDGEEEDRPRTGSALGHLFERVRNLFR